MMPPNKFKYILQVTPNITITIRSCIIQIPIAQTTIQAVIPIPTEFSNMCRTSD